LLATWQARFEFLAVLLLLEAGILVLTRRRGRAAPLLRVLLPATVIGAIGAIGLAAYTWWQISQLSPHLPFRRLPDGGIQYARPLAVDIAQAGGAVLLSGAFARYVRL
jgi:hypothetical protein